MSRKKEATKMCRCGRKPSVVLVDGDSGAEVPVCAVCMFGLDGNQEGE